MTNIGGPATGETETSEGGCIQHYATWKRNLCRNARGSKAGKLISIGTENDCIAYRVGILYSAHLSGAFDIRYNPCGSVGSRADGDS